MTSSTPKIKEKNKKKIFYISTPIYYANAEPHLGHAYSTLYADFLARFQKLQNKKVFFVTGCDQHGNKMLSTAQKKGVSIEVLVKENTQSFQKLWKEIDISYTHFVETRSEKHIQFVQKMFQKLKEKKQIYLDKYEGFYCVSCENFLKNKTLKNDNKGKICGICQKEARFVKEKNFFFKIEKKDKNFLKTFLEKRKAEKQIGSNWLEQLNNFLEKEKLDFSISRFKNQWSFPLNPKYPEQKAYVWFDALWSYISFLKEEEKQEIWNIDKNQIVQVLGKEITKFHLIYWPLLLNKSGWKIPNHFLIHGWILNNEEKMSKSIGNVVKPKKIIQKYGIDVFRLFVASLIRPRQDIKYQEKILEKFYRDELVNNFSNYLYRLLNMVKKYKPDFNQIMNLQSKFDNKTKWWNTKIKDFIFKYHQHFENFQINKALKITFELLNFANQSINKEKPWKLNEEKNEYLTFFLFYLLVIVKISGLFFKPFAPNLSNKVLKSINLEEEINFDLQLNWKKAFYVDKVVKFFE